MALLFSMMHDIFESDEEGEEEEENQQEREVRLKMKIKEETDKETVIKIEKEQEEIDEMLKNKKDIAMKLEKDAEIEEIELMEGEYFLIEELEEQENKVNTKEKVQIKQEEELGLEEEEDSMVEDENLTDEEEEESLTEPKKKKRKYDSPSRKLYTYLKPMDMNEYCFIKSFGLNKYTFKKLLNYIEPKMKMQYRNSCIPNAIKLAILLKFCVHGSHQKNMGTDFYFNLAQPTVSAVMQEMLNVLEENICSKWIKFNRSDEEVFRGKQYFYRKSRFPSVIGIVDTTHIKILGPEKGIQDMYFNRAKSFSLNVLIVCDHNKLIRYIDARNPGSVDDWDVWEMSNLDRNLHDNYSKKENGWLLGDSNFPLKPYLMTPFRNAQKTSLEDRYNQGHNEARIIIKHTIQIFKSRFKCLLGNQPLHYVPEKVTQIVNVCAALHNICVKFKVSEPEIIDTNDNLDDDITYLENTNCKPYKDGKKIRQTIAECYLVNIDF